MSQLIGTLAGHFLYDLQPGQLLHYTWMDCQAFVKPQREGARLHWCGQRVGSIMIDNSMDSWSSIYI